jgi:glyoxylase-like metal-dependent hydrolase (beta-lactamase superfamily II)
MTNGIYRFRLGEFVCTVISDGRYVFAPPTFPVPADFLYSNAPRDQIEVAFQKRILKLEERYFWAAPLNCLLVDSGDHQILIDAGGGGFGRETGRLYKNLLAAGASPNSINWVILTHAHPDRIGGITDESGRTIFPNAHFVMAREEWNFWRGERAKNEIHEFNREILLKTANKNLPAIQNQLELVDGEVDILPGVSILTAPGHTPGQIAVKLSSQNRNLLVLADVFYHPIQIQCPEWSGIADLDTWHTVKTRIHFLNQAVAENALVMGFHFPFPGLGWVIQHSGGFVWLEHKMKIETPQTQGALTGG